MASRARRKTAAEAAVPARRNAGGCDSTAGRDAGGGEEGRRRDEEGGGEVTVFDVDDGVDARGWREREERREPEGVGGWLKPGRRRAPRGRGREQEDARLRDGWRCNGRMRRCPGRGRGSGKMRIGVGLDVVVEVRRGRTSRDRCRREAAVVEDGRVFEELAFGMFEMDLGYAEVMVWFAGGASFRCRRRTRRS